MAAALPARIPKAPLLAGAALLAVTLAVIGPDRLMGRPAPTVADGIAVQSRDLRFEDRADGAVEVRDARTGASIAVVPEGSGGFIRGAMRALTFDRREIGAAPPWRLTAWQDGRVTLEDTATGRRVDLDAFGPTNAGAFARLLNDGGR